MDYSFWLLIFASLVSLIPLYLSIYRFRVLKIRDYLFFILWSINAISIGIVLFINEYDNKIWYWKLRESLIIFFFLLIYIQAVRIYQFESKILSRGLLALGTAVWMLLEFLITRWRFIDTNDNYFFRRLPITQAASIDQSINIGSAINNSIIYSTLYLWPRIFLGLISFLFFFLSHFRLRPLFIDLRATRALNLWKAVSVCGLSFMILELISPFYWINPSLATVFLFSASVLISIIAILYPEGFLLTKGQITKLFSLYNISQLHKLDIVKETHSELYSSLLTALDSVNAMDTKLMYPSENSIVE